MCAIPFFHVYGLVVAMVYGMSIGAEMQIVPNPRPLDNVMNIMQKSTRRFIRGCRRCISGLSIIPNVANCALRSIKY
jgi:long-chain acyl-CoA synthetase